MSAKANRMRERTPIRAARGLLHLSDGQMARDAQNLAAVEKALSAALSDHFDRLRGEEAFPSVDMRDDGDHIAIDADIPGVEPKDVTVSFREGRLVIRGERKSAHAELGANHYLAELRHGTFERILPVPDGIAENLIAVSFDKGVLSILLRKLARDVASGDGASGAGP
ncbi:Hsp20/alpha crystallin family protein [Alsobacter sp. R-9]